MAQLQRDNDGVTEYAYREVEVQSGKLGVLIWDESDSRDGEIVWAKGASNERQLLAVPDDAKSMEHLTVQDAIQGQDAMGEDIHVYSLLADNAAYDAMKMDEIRAERDVLLRDSDFSQLDDAPYNASSKAEWATYRQALRDLPASVGDVDDVTWPVKPS